MSEQPDQTSATGEPSVPEELPVRGLSRGTRRPGVVWIAGALVLALTVIGLVAYVYHDRPTQDQEAEEAAPGDPELDRSPALEGISGAVEADSADSADGAPGDRDARDARDEPAGPDSSAPVVLTLEPVRDEMALRSLRFLSEVRPTASRLTLDRYVVERAFRNETAFRDGEYRYAALLYALLRDSEDLPSAESSSFEELFSPTVREYLPQETTHALREIGTIRSAYRVQQRNAMPPYGYELALFVLFLDDGAVQLNVYLEDDLIVDAEVIHRDWTPRQSLAKGEAGEAGIFP